MSDNRAIVNATPTAPIHASICGCIHYGMPTRRPHRFFCHLTGTHGQRIRVRASGPDELHNCLTRLYRAGWLQMNYTGRA